jgi:hypothetical protein
VLQLCEAVAAGKLGEFTASRLASFSATYLAQLYASAHIGFGSRRWLRCKH